MAAIDATGKPYWFSIELRPMPRNTTRRQWKDCDRWRRIIQRLLRESDPTPPTIDFGPYGFGVEPTNPGA